MDRWTNDLRIYTLFSRQQYLSRTKNDGKVTMKGCVQLNPVDVNGIDYIVCIVYKKEKILPTGKCAGTLSIFFGHTWI